MKWNMTCFDALSPLSPSFRQVDKSRQALQLVKYRSYCRLSYKYAQAICELQSNKTWWESSMIGHLLPNETKMSNWDVTKEMFYK